MNVFVLTIFPELFDSFWNTGIVRKAIDIGKLFYFVLRIGNSLQKRCCVKDDRPFGGGCGMLMKPEPLVSSIKAAKKIAPSSLTILLSPQGKILNHQLVKQIASVDSLIFICGRYEGVDERVIDKFVDFEVSVGDYILTGGELPAMIMIDTMSRFIPGVLNNPSSVEMDTFSDGLLKYAQYTRPRVFDGELVPEVLVSGNHVAIEKWRVESSLMRTLFKRKDLLKNRKLTVQEMNILKKWHIDIECIIKKQFNE